MSSAVGAYGLRLCGPRAPATPGDLFLPAEPDWPAVRLEAERGTAADLPEPFVDDVAAVMHSPLGGGVRVRRDPFTVTVVREHDGDDDWLAHPDLAVAAALAAWWDGREAFHGGAVALDGRAWGVLAEKEVGKSTLLAHLLEAGHTVVADDVVSVDDGHVLTGPRCVDLRPGSAERLAHLPSRWVRDDSRLRLLAGPCPPRVPLAGWVVPVDADDVGLERVPVLERLGVLSAHRALRLSPARPELLLDLAALPMVRLRRPRRWDAMPSVVQAVRWMAAG